MRLDIHIVAAAYGWGARLLECVMLVFYRRPGPDGAAGAKIGQM